MGLFDGKREWNPGGVVKSYEGVVRAQGFELVDRAGEPVACLGHFARSGVAEYGLQVVIPQSRRGEDEADAIVRLTRSLSWADQPQAQVLSLRANSKSSGIVFHDPSGRPLVVLEQDHGEHAFTIRFLSRANDRVPSTTISHDGDATSFDIGGTLRMRTVRLVRRERWPDGAQPPEDIKEAIRKEFKDLYGADYHVAVREIGRVVKVEPAWLFSTLPQDIEARDLVAAEIARVLRTHRYYYELESETCQTEVTGDGLRVKSEDDGLVASVEADGMRVDQDDREDSPVFFGFPDAPPSD